MFKWDELEALKEAALARDAFQEVIVYQNEQMIRELRTLRDKSGALDLPSWNKQEE